MRKITHKQQISNRNSEILKYFMEHEYDDVDKDTVDIDIIAKHIVMHDSNSVKDLLELFCIIDIRSSDNAFTSDNRSLIEIAVRANDLEIVEMLLNHYVHASDISSDSVIHGFLNIQPLRLAIELGYNKIANYLFERGSYLMFPGDVSILGAIRMVKHYKNKELTENFIDRFKYYYSDIIEMLQK